MAGTIDDADPAQSLLHGQRMRPLGGIDVAARPLKAPAGTAGSNPQFHPERGRILSFGRELLGGSGWAPGAARASAGIGANVYRPDSWRQIMRVWTLF